jgi:hypothetical protein
MAVDRLYERAMAGTRLRSPPDLKHILITREAVASFRISQMLPHVLLQVAPRGRMRHGEHKDLGAIFRTPRPIIGKVHCWPLPGAPGDTGHGMGRIALRDHTS